MMDADRRRIGSLAMVLVLLLLLSGCDMIGGFGGQPANFKKYVGTSGITVMFMQDAPPTTLYELRPFPVRIELQNRGAADVNYSDMRISFSYDPLYIKGGLAQYDLRQYDLDNTGIMGRSLAYRDGQQFMFSMPTDAALETKAIPGQRESPDTTLTTSVCYKYSTFFSSDTCIDTNIYSQNARSQPCQQPKDKTVSGGQGAPIAITKISVTSIPELDRDTGVERVKPQFTIGIQDVGGGYLIGPDTLKVDDACMLKNIARQETNAVRIEAWLLNTKLVCGELPITQQRGIVQLADKSAEVVCYVPQDKLSDPIFSSTQNFQTILTVNLSYIYKASASQRLQIQRIPGTQQQSYPFWMYGKKTGYLYEGDVACGLPSGYSVASVDPVFGTAIPSSGGSGTVDASGGQPQISKPIVDDEGYPVTKCDFFAQNPTCAPESIKLTKQFQCSCSQDRCNTLANIGNCVFGLCPGESYCCTDPSPSYINWVGEPPDWAVDVPNIGSNPDKQTICEALALAERRYGMPEDLLKAIAYTESTWNPQTTRGDGGVSYGLMQINTKAHSDYQTDSGFENVGYNIGFGAYFLYTLYERENDWKAAVTCYNGCPQGVKFTTYTQLVFNYWVNKPWKTSFGVTC